MSDINFTKDDLPGDDRAHGEENELVRQQSWPVDGTPEVEIAVELGRIKVQLDEQGEVRVEVRHDPTAGGGWAQGVSGFVNWLGNASASWASSGFPGKDFAGFGNTDVQADDAADLAAQAVRAAEISWSDTGKRLVVRSAPDMPLRLVPLAVTVWAPAGTRVAARTGSGDVTVTGRAGWAAVRTGSGQALVSAVDGDLDVTTGSGDVEVGEVSGRARIRTGSGNIRLDAVSGPADVKAGSGDVVLGTIAADLGARTGSGEVRIADAVSGSFDITTGSGDLTLALHPGVLADVDLSSGSGRTRSDLDVSTVAPGRPAELRVRGRTGTGDVLVTRASVSV